MESNFNEIKETLKGIIYESEKIEYFEKLIDTFENSIFSRNLHYIKLDIRYLYDFILYDFFGSILKTDGKKISKSTTNSNALIDLLLEKGIIFDDEELGKMIKKSNRNVHSNLKNTSKFRNSLRFKELSLSEMQAFAESFFNTLVEGIKYHYEEQIGTYFDYQKFNFDKEIYVRNLNLLWTDNEIEKLKKEIDTKCKFCNEGKITIPKNGIFPYGHFLKCDNDKCGAILSKNLNLKVRIDETCLQCNKELSKVLDLNSNNLSIECSNYQNCNYKR